MIQFLILSLNNDPSEVLGTMHAGGQTKYVLELTKNLLFEGHSVDVFTIGKSGQPVREEFVPGAYVTRFFRPAGKPYGYDITTEELVLLANEIAAYVLNKAMSIDIIVCCYWISSRAAMKLKLIWDCPLIVTFCQLAVFKKKGTNRTYLKDRFNSEREIGLFADAVIATSLTEKKHLVMDYQLPENKIHIIPRGINLSVFYP